MGIQYKSVRILGTELPVEGKVPHEPASACRYLGLTQGFFEVSNYDNFCFVRNVLKCTQKFIQIYGLFD